MVTEIGKFLRILRVSRDESAKSMADKLGVSPSYLSAVELGKRQIPLTWEEIIIKEYSLNDKNKEKLRKAIEESKSSLKIDVSEVGSKKKQILFSVANGEVDDETIEKLCEIIKQNKKEGVK